MRIPEIMALAVPWLSFVISAQVTQGIGGSLDDNSPKAPAPLQAVYTEHLGSIIDSARNPSVPIGMTGTDLGSSFERDGKLVFLFGDAQTTDRAYWDGDPAAWVDPAANPLVTGIMPKLNWYLEKPNQFLPLRIANINLGPMNVPVEAVAIGPDTYVFAATDFDLARARHSSLALARTTGLAFESLALVNVRPTGKFIVVSVIREGDTLYIFGSGHYRQSAVFLARVKAAQLAERDAWTYFRGYKQGAPVFGPSESSAAPLVEASCVGELSVRRHEGLGYLMSYNCDNPRGINLRFAENPTGPWSRPTVIFHPETDRGYGFFMHQWESAVGYDDGLAAAGRNDEPGGEYGPYLVPQWMRTEAPGVFSIVYTLSSWNPYKVHLMRSIVARPDVLATPPPPRGTNLPRAKLVNGDFATGDLSGWQTSGSPFAVEPGSPGQWRLTTHVASRGGIGLQGAAWQDFTIDAKTRELRFEISGGDAASVKLLWLKGGEVVDTVRASWGPRSDLSERSVRWLLDDLHGETVRLLIEDPSADDWGYIRITGFTFVQDP